MSAERTDFAAPHQAIAGSGLALETPPVGSPPGHVSPWLGLWIAPRRSMRQLLDAGPTRMVWLLSVIGGVSGTLERAVSRSLGDRLEFHWVILFCVVGGALLGPPTLVVGSALVGWTGRWIGGRASAADLRSALAWPHVISAPMLVAWIALILAFGAELFKSEPVTSPSLEMVLVGLKLGVLQILLSSWWLVVQLKCLGEAQHMSAWRALGNLCLAFAVLLVPVVVVLATLTMVLVLVG